MPWSDQPPMELEKFVMTMEAWEIVAKWHPPEEAGRIVRQFRCSRGWSQQQLAKLCGCQSQSTLTRWEDGSKQPADRHRERLLALMKPIGSTMDGHDIPAFVAQMKAEYPDPVERRHRFLDEQYDEIMCFLALRCKGFVLPGISDKAIALFAELHDKAEREYRLQQRQADDSKKISTRGRRWLKGEGVTAEKSSAAAPSEPKKPTEEKPAEDPPPAPTEPEI